MSQDKKITATELPEMITDFIGEYISDYLGGFVGVDKAIRSQEILYYSFMAEQYTLKLQELMIESYYSEKPEPLSVNPPNTFSIKALNDTMHAFQKQYSVSTEGLEDYFEFLDNYRQKFIRFLIDRNKKKGS